MDNLSETNTEQLLGEIGRGFRDAIDDASLIGNKPNTNGYTLAHYQQIRAKIEQFDFFDRIGQASPYQIAYLDAFDAVASKAGYTGDGEEE